MLDPLVLQIKGTDGDDMLIVMPGNDQHVLKIVLTGGGAIEDTWIDGYVVRYTVAVVRGIDIATIGGGVARVITASGFFKQWLLTKICWLSNLKCHWAGFVWLPVGYFSSVHLPLDFK